MLVENGGNVILRRGLPADVLPLFTGIRHVAAHSGADDGQLQFSKDCRHLDEGLAHWVDFAVTAVNRDTAENDESHVFPLNGVYDAA